MDKVEHIPGGVKITGKFLGKEYKRAYTDKSVESMRMQVKFNVKALAKSKTRFLRASNHDNPA